MMDADVFWGLIDEARKPTGSKPTDPSAVPGNLEKVLSKKTDDEVGQFAAFFNERLCDLNRWELWGAGYVIAGGMGDDSFHYFRSWIIGKGKAAYEAAANPGSLGDFVGRDEDVDNESLEYVALEILENRKIEEDPRDASERFPDDEPEGEPFDEDEVERSYPKLAARFG